MPDACLLDATDNEVRAAWADLLDRSDQATPFSTLAFAEAVRDVLGYPFRLAGVMEGGRLSAGVLLFERRRGPYRTVVVPPMTPYTTFLFDPPLRETDIHQRRSALDALLALLEGHYHALAFHLHPSITDVRPFQWSGYDVQPLYTYRAPLADRATLLSRFSKGTRKRFTRDLDDYDVGRTRTHYEATAHLIGASYGRHGRRPLITEARMVRLAEHLSAHPSLLYHYSARRHGAGQPEGGQWILRSNHTFYTWAGASERGPAMTLMLVQAMLDFHADGLATYDHIGANTPSIAEFKRSFGASLTPYFRVVRFLRGELRWLHGLRPLL